MIALGGLGLALAGAWAWVLPWLGPLLALAAPWWQAARAWTPSGRAVSALLVAGTVFAGLFLLWRWVGDDALDNLRTAGLQTQVEAMRQDAARAKRIDADLEAARRDIRNRDAMIQGLEAQLLARLDDLAAAKSVAEGDEAKCRVPAERLNRIIREVSK